MTVHEKLRKRSELVLKTGLHVIDEINQMSEGYSRLYGLDPDALASFAALVLTEALINKKIMLRKED